MSMWSFVRNSFFAGDESNKSRFQEAMFSVYLRDLTLPVIQSLGIVLVLFIGGVGELTRFIYPEEQVEIAVMWRFYTCLILGVVVVATAVFRGAKNWINCIFATSYGTTALISGYYLSQLRTPNSAGMYLLYLLPLLTIIMPAGLRFRLFVNATTLLALVGIYASIGWNASLFMLFTVILIGSCVTSAILGHGVFYRLNREAFFDDRELTRQRQRIEFLARHDQLTGLYNRREFERKLEEEFDRSERYGSTLSLLMIDLDHFKQVNDTYGHTAGDSVLETMGELLSDEANQSVRVSDVPGRYGGEEFCLLLPETRSNGAVAVADRIRDALESKTFTADGTSFSVTCSIGVAAFREDMSHSEQLVQAADDALYKAKNSGRNRVVNADEIEVNRDND